MRKPWHKKEKWQQEKKFTLKFFIYGRHRGKIIKEWIISHIYGRDTLMITCSSGNMGEKNWRV